MKYIGMVLLGCVLALAGCTTTDFQTQVTSTCANIDPFMRALAILDEAGELSAANHKKYVTAQETVASFCTPGAVVNWQTAVTTLAVTYVLVAKIKKEEAPNG